MSFSEQFFNVPDYAVLIFVVAFFLWFLIDNYLLTRYGGKLNRGLTIWRQPLSADEYRFLTNLDRDVVKVEKHGSIIKRKWMSFIAVSNGEALIRYSKLSWKTSWPMVFYVDLTTPRPEFEYRMSLPGLLLWLAFASAPIFSFFSTSRIGAGLFILAFFVFMIGVSIVVETTGCKEFLARQTELFLIQTTSQERMR